MKKKSDELPSVVCRICRKPMPVRKKPPYRRTCSNACRQKQYREAHGQEGWRQKRKKKEDAERWALPLTEHVFAETNKPVVKLGERRGIYECQVCGKRTLVERINAPQRVSAFCSDRCEQTARNHWKRFTKARYVALAVGRLDPRVDERLDLKKSSPICPHCGIPFVPNRTADGRKMPGRPRKYCSDVCRRAAYEKRYKRQNSVARRHRFRECAECGTYFDRSDKRGRRTMRFCGKPCQLRFNGRVQRARRRVMWDYHRKDKWLKAFKRYSDKHGYAARNSTKQKMKQLAESDKVIVLGKRARLGGWRLGG